MTAQATDAQLVRVDDVPPQPWRNGGGVTRELLALPTPADWRMRISVADIEADGPFSSYPGVERWFAVLQGRGVALSVDGLLHRLTRHDAPLRFSGAAAATCRLIDGPTRDLNLMLRDARGTLEGVAPGERWLPPADSAGLFTGVAGRCLVDGASVDLPAQALLWLDRAPASLRFEPLRSDCEGPAGWWLAAELGAAHA